MPSVRNQYSVAAVVSSDTAQTDTPIRSSSYTEGSNDQDDSRHLARQAGHSFLSQYHAASATVLRAPTYGASPAAGSTRTSRTVGLRLQDEPRTSTALLLPAVPTSSSEISAPATSQDELSRPVTLADTLVVRSNDGKEFPVLGFQLNDNSHIFRRRLDEIKVLYNNPQTRDQVELVGEHRTPVLTLPECNGTILDLLIC